MSNRIIFTRNLNLLVEEDLSDFFKELTRVGYPIPAPTEDDLKNLIQYGGEFFPKSYFEITVGMTPLEEQLVDMIRRGQTDEFMQDILPILCFLYTFRGNIDFISRVKTNLANIPQFGDTLFELNCLNRFHKNGFSFQYESEVLNMGAKRNPDFLLTKDGVELFCECKQVRVGQNRAELKFSKDHDYVVGKFSKTLQKQLSDAKLLMEINFKNSATSHDLNELARQVNQLCDAAQGISPLPLREVGCTIEYLVIKQEEPSPFPSIGRVRNLSFQVTIGTPFKIGNPFNAPGGEISFVSTDLARRTSESFSNIIQEAKRQLPEDKPAIMIINRTKLTIAEEAIKRRMSLRRYNNIIAFAINPFDGFSICYQPQYRELLHDLFEGFQPANPFTSA